jgi:hypothetical protein
VGERLTKKHPYGPSRAFTCVVAVAVAAQVWWALPDSAVSRDTAELERVVYGELQTQSAVGDVRCTRVSREAANCVATLADLGRVRVRAEIDARSGAITSEVVDATRP